jgi:hypothetical protein
VFRGKAELRVNDPLHHGKRAALPMKEASAPQRNPIPRQTPNRRRWACFKFRCGRKAGEHGEAGMESEEGRRLSTFLGASSHRVFATALTL